MKINNSLLKIKSFILNTDADFKTSIILNNIQYTKAVKVL